MAAACRIPARKRGRRERRLLPYRTSTVGSQRDKLVRKLPSHLPLKSPRAVDIKQLIYLDPQQNPLPPCESQQPAFLPTNTTFRQHNPLLIRVRPPLLPLLLLLFPKTSTKYPFPPAHLAFLPISPIILLPLLPPPSIARTKLTRPSELERLGTRFVVSLLLDTLVRKRVPLLLYARNRMRLVPWSNEKACAPTRRGMSVG